MKKLETFATAVDPSGSDRVRLVYEASADANGFDFDSIVWEKHSGGQWHEHARITEEQFEADSDRSRWPSELDSFDASSGLVIAKIAEGDAPKDSGTIQYNYSWRRWDLTKNEEAEYLYGLSMEELFDPYKPERSGQDSGSDP